MISSTRAKQSLEYEFGLRAFTPEPYYYLGLSSTNPAIEITEPSASAGYARVVIANSAASWGEVADGEYHLKNVAAFAFPILTQEAEDVSYWFLAISADGMDVPPYYGELSSKRPMPADSQTFINVGEMKIYRENPS